MKSSSNSEISSTHLKPLHVTFVTLPDYKDYKRLSILDVMIPYFYYNFSYIYY